jgi:hypothetical protein
MSLIGLTWSVGDDVSKGERCAGGRRISPVRDIQARVARRSHLMAALFHDIWDDEPDPATAGPGRPRPAACQVVAADVVPAAACRPSARARIAGVVSTVRAGDGRTVARLRRAFTRES